MSLLTYTHHHRSILEQKVMVKCDNYFYYILSQLRLSR